MRHSPLLFILFTLFTTPVFADLKFPESTLVVTSTPADRITLGDADRLERCRAIQEALKISKQGSCLPGAPSRNSKYLITLEEADSTHEKGALALTVKNLKPFDDVDFKQTGWIIEAGATRETQYFYMKKKLADFAALSSHDALKRDAALTLASPLSHTIEVDSKTGEFKSKTTGKILTLNQAQEKFTSENPANKHYLRTFVEIAAAVGLGWVGYNTVFKELSIVDYDFNASWPSQRHKLLAGQGIQFDSNPFMINEGHVAAGALYYLFARSNHLSSLESLLMSVMGSALWEGITEYREAVGINDMITTPIGGAVMGEVFYQLGEHFDSGAPTLVNKILGMVFGGQRRFHNWVDRTHHPRSVDLDAYGFNANTWHSFKLYAGGSATTRTENSSEKSGQIELGFNTEIISAPQFAKAGKVSGRLLMDTYYTQFLMHSGIGADGLNDFLLLTKAAWMGYHKQEIEKGADEKFRGYSLLIGAASAYDLTIQKMKSGITDTLGVINILGPRIDAVFYIKGVKIKTSLDVYGDYAQVRSLAADKAFQALGLNTELADAKAQPGSEALTSKYSRGEVLGTKGTLELDRTYHAFGVTSTASVAVEFDSFEFGASGKAQHYESVERLDRYQDQMRPGRDFHLTDTRLQGRVWVAYHLPRGLLHSDAAIEMYAEHIQRDGTLDAFKNEEALTTYGGKMIFGF